MDEKRQLEMCCPFHYLINIASKQVVKDPMNHLLSQNGCFCDSDVLLFALNMSSFGEKNDLICLSVEPTTLTAKNSKCY